jgi:hypothetical protein
VEIDQIHKMDLAEIEPLYWIVEDSLYANQTDRAKSMFRLLCLFAKYRKPDMIKILRPRQMERLSEISYELYGEKSYRQMQPIQMKWPLNSTKIPFSREKELQAYLQSHTCILGDALGESVRVTGIEVKTDFDYACDVVAESNEVFYPIELKIRQSKHGVVSQIEKYCFYFYRTLRYNRYKRIQGVVIANGFDAYSINELRRSGIRIFNIAPLDKDEIRLEEVT